MKSSYVARVFGGSEPWFDVMLKSGDPDVNEAIATQPLSCFVAIADGRRTALMCAGGVLALRVADQTLNVEYHTLSGAKIEAFGPASEYRARVDSLSNLTDT